MTEQVTIGQTHYNKLVKLQQRLFECAGTLAMSGLPYSMTSGMVDGLNGIVQDLSEILPTLTVTKSGRGRRTEASSGEPDFRTPEQIAADEADGLEVII